MNKAETIVDFDNYIYKLANTSVIDYITSKGLQINDTIQNNPYFKYKLFNIFSPILHDIITGLAIHNDILYIKGQKSVYNIYNNSDEGLTLEVVIDTNDGNELFIKNKEIYQIIPNNNQGIILIEHKKILVGNINMDLVDSEESLNMNYIDSDGLMMQSQFVNLKQSSNRFILNEKIDIYPLLLKEYYSLFNILSSNENCFLRERKRDSNDLFKIIEYEKMGNIKTEKTKYFVNGNLLSSIELENFYSGKSLSDYDIYNMLKHYTIPDSIISCILNNIAKRCGLSFNTCSINICNEHLKDRLILDNIFESHNNKYTV